MSPSVPTCPVVQSPNPAKTSPQNRRALVTTLDATTGKLLEGFGEVQQSLEKILTTPQGARLQREWFGNPGLQLLGQNMTPQTILLWYTIVWTLVELFEPRFKIKRFATTDADRLGELGATIIGEHRPYAHLDWQQAAVYVSVSDGSVRVRSGA